MATAGSTAQVPSSRPLLAARLSGFIGPLLYLRDPLRFITRLADRPGDIQHFHLRSRHVFLLKHPEHIREVLVVRQHDFAKGEGLRWAQRFLGQGLLTSEGEFHTRQRRLAQPAFHRQRIAAYGQTMVDHGLRLRESWQAGETRCLHRDMMALTLAVAGETLFGTDTGPVTADIAEALNTIVHLFPLFILPFADVLQRLPLPANRRFQRARGRLDAVVYRIIAERRRAGTDRGDLLSMLLLASDAEGGGGGMTDVQLRDEVMTLILAGHETTANALSWTFHLLALNPEAEGKLHAELDAVLQGRRPTVDDVPRLVYAERVVAESMRLFPPAWALGRRALREQSLDGWPIPAGALVLASPYVTQRDARWFPEPERFDPERWTPEARAARPRFAYFPFGGGARSCIGEPFAWLESILLLSTLAQAWRLRPVPGRVVAPEALITLRPRGGLPMRFERRA